MSRGYMGKLLWVDLTTGSMRDEELSEEFCRKYIGGYGIGSRILIDRTKPNVDPLGPDNLLGFLTGVLTGTPAIIGSRYVVVCKSPLTNTWGDANSGGSFGPYMKFAGYDGVFFTGKSEKPVYLTIINGESELHDAGEIWGKDTHDTEDILKEAHGKETRIACIGTAGEMQSKIACVINDKGRAAGRSGVGAVMGSKGLKAVLVSGSLPVPMEDEAAAKALRNRILKEEKEAGAGLKNYGTCEITAPAAMSGDSPVKNWGGAGPVDFPSAGAISDDSVVALQEKKYYCWRCPLGCGGRMKAVEGKYAVPAGVHKPEYETLAAFGNSCLNDNLESIIKINDICNRSGIDTISAGSTVAFAIECYENGIISDDDTGGLKLNWGNDEAIVELTSQIAARTGFGKLLSDGVKIAAERIGNGADQFAMHVGGQELAMHDPRFTPGLALTYQLEATPGRHTQGGELIAPPGGTGLDFDAYERTEYSGRGEDQKKLVNLMHVVNSAGLCMFGYLSYSSQAIPDFLTAVTGWEWTMHDVLEAGERIANVRRMFNLREGVNPLEWKVPGRMLGHPPLTEGNVRGIDLDDTTMIKEFLAAMDWDETTMKPSDKKLRQLDLADLIT
ncbi:MAG: aldehyde ferredoxin oxidoreductase family protein [Spirochaetales bacterium]|jgi:aldehyde:ferredoxin oxidoreductase|nr:aldehyde ferredoxin oxidoreductase family protein [Spirochaetales bacterium]